MNRCRHTSGILDTLLDPGAVLSAGQHRHLTGCDVCASATRRALALEDSLARELSWLRTEPLPRTVLATPPYVRHSRRQWIGLPSSRLVLGFATAVLAAAVAAGGMRLLDPTWPFGIPGDGFGGTTAAEPSVSPQVALGETAMVTDGAQAAALVLATDPIFGGLTVLPAASGGDALQSTYEVDGDEYAITIRLGWGECVEDACDYAHTWRYRVDGVGTVQLLERAGDDPLGPDGYPFIHQIDADGELALRACVDTDPADACPSAWLGAAEIILRNAQGEELTRGATAPFSGRVSLAAPAGAYVVESQAVEGYETPPRIAASLFGDGTTSLDLAYGASALPDPGPVGEVVTDELVVRSLPMVHDDSIIIGELGPGTEVRVIDGPVVGSGYEWYEVAPVTDAAIERGWVAAASKETPPEEWLRLPDRPMLPGSDCQPVRPVRLPSGAPTGEVRLTWREATWFAAWGSEGDLVEQSVGSFGLPDVEQASFEPASVRGAVARVIPAEDGRMTLSWQIADCRYTVWLGPGVTQSEVVEYATRY